MNIDFPDNPPVYCGPDLVLTFPAIVDGELIKCSITAEALEDHFGAESPREEDTLRAFNRNRRKIENAARALLQEVGHRPIILHSGYLRFCH